MKVWKMVKKTLAFLGIFPFFRISSGEIRDNASDGNAEKELYEQKGGTVTYATVAIWRCCLSWAGGNHSVRSARIRQPTAVNRNRVRRLLMRTFGIQPSPPSASNAFLLHVVRKTPHDCSQPKADPSLTGSRGFSICKAGFFWDTSRTWIRRIRSMNAAVHRLKSLVIMPRQISRSAQHRITFAQGWEGLQMRRFMS